MNPEEFNTMIPIPGYSGYYVTDKGEVFSRRWGYLRKLRPVIVKTGYPRVGLQVGSKMKWKMVHQLVLTAFVGEKEPGMVTRHLNGIRTDNRLANLRWGTYAENGQDRKLHGTTYITSGEKNSHAKLTADKVLEIRASASPTKTLIPLYGVGKKTINDIRGRRTWRHI